MKRSNYLVTILCLVLVIANNSNFDIFSRTAVGAVGVLLLLDVIKETRRLLNERGNKEA